VNQRKLERDPAITLPSSGYKLHLLSTISYNQTVEKQR